MTDRTNGIYLLTVTYRLGGVEIQIAAIAVDNQLGAAIGQIDPVGHLGLLQAQHCWRGLWPLAGEQIELDHLLGAWLEQLQKARTHFEFDGQRLATGA